MTDADRREAELMARLASLATGYTEPDRGRALATVGRELLELARDPACGDRRRITDMALRALGDGHSALEPGDPERSQVAWLLGLHLTNRYMTGAADADRDTAVDMLTECGPGHQYAGLLLGMLRIFRSFPAGSMRPLNDLAQHANDGRVVDVTAIKALIDTPLGPSTPAQAAELGLAMEGLRSVGTAGLPEQIAGMVQGLLGLGGMLGGSTDRPPSELLGFAADTWSGTGSQELSALTLLAKVNESQDASPDAIELLAGDVEQAARELPPQHVMRTLLITELADLHLRLAGKRGNEVDVTGPADILAAGLSEIETDHLLYDHLLRSLAGFTLTGTALDPTEARVSQAIELAQRVLRRPATDPASTGRDRFLMGMAKLLQASGSSHYDDLAAAVDELKEAVSLLPSTDRLAPTALATLGAVLLDRYQLHGGLEDLDAAVSYLGRAADEQRRADHSGPGDQNLLGILAHGQVLQAIRRAEPAALDGLAAKLRAILDGLPAGNFGRAQTTSSLGVALIAKGVYHADVESIREGCAALADAMTESSSNANKPSLVARAGIARVAQGLLSADPQTRLQLVDEGIATIHAADEQPAFIPWEKARNLSTLGFAYRTRAAITGSPADIDRAIMHYESAYLLSGAELGFADAARPLGELSRAYWERNSPDGVDRHNAIAIGIEELSARMDDVLLQSGADDGLLAARGVAERANELAAWCRCTADPQRLVRVAEILELGRGIVLHMARATAGVQDILTAQGLDELGGQWLTVARQRHRPSWPRAALAERESELDLAARELAVTSALEWEPPPDIRLRVLMELPQRAEVHRPPSAPEIVEALQASALDAIVYLVPGEGEQGGYALVQRATGELFDLELRELTWAASDALPTFLEAAHQVDANNREQWREALVQVCDWAGRAAMGPLLAQVSAWQLGRPARLVLVACSTLSAVPWHAAVVDGGCVIDELLITYAATARQLIEATRRQPVALGARPVLIGNPNGDIPYTGIAVGAIRDSYYPHATVYGLVEGESAGAGTAEEVLSHAPGSPSPASMLHLGCHAHLRESATQSYLELATGPQPHDGTLPIAVMLRQAQAHGPSPAGGLVFLSSCVSDLASSDHEEALTIASTFLSAGARTVIGTRWKVWDVHAAIFTLVFHGYLLGGAESGERDPAQALNATQRWMRDPHRQVPPAMPKALREEIHHLGSTGRDLADPECWAAFALHGC